MPSPQEQSHDLSHRRARPQDARAVAAQRARTRRAERHASGARPRSRRRRRPRRRWRDRARLERARRSPMTRALRLLVVLALTGTAWLAASGPAHAAVGVPVIIDSFGNPNIDAGLFTRTVIPLPLPHTSTTPQGTFSEADGVGSMAMTGLGNGTSGITLSYTPRAGGSVDLTGGGSNGQIFIDFAAISGDRGLTTYMKATDANGG